MSATATPILEGQGDFFVPPETMEYEERLRYVAHNEIRPDPEQPRKHPDPELRESIRINGLLQPVTVRRDPERLDGYMLVDGERRWRSAEGVLDRIPCIVREDLDERLVRLQTQIVANTGKPLEPIEEARAYAELILQHETVAALAQAVGRPESSVRERLALLELGPWVDWIADGRLPLSHAVKVLLPLRACPDEVHAHAITLIEKDYRAEKDDKTGRIVGSVARFESAAHNAYRGSMYPLNKSKSGYGTKQPAFDTKAHDQECDCGGIPFEVDHGGKRKCCGNPKWWRPLLRKAKAAAPKKKARTSDSGRPAIRYYPPEGAKVRTHKGYDDPSGVTLLTKKGEARWNLQAAFDPAHLAASLAPEHLVFVDTPHGPVVGTTDTKAVTAAKEQWRARWQGRLDGIRTALAKQLKDKAKAYDVRGPGLGELLVRLVRNESGRGPETIGQTCIDVATALGHELPATVRYQSGWNEGDVNTQALAQWLGKQEDKDLAAIATGIGFMLATRTPSPTAKVDQEIKAEGDRIAKKPIPWRKAAKATKGKTADVDVDEEEDADDDE